MDLFHKVQFISIIINLNPTDMLVKTVLNENKCYIWHALQNLMRCAPLRRLTTNHYQSRSVHNTVTYKTLIGISPLKLGSEPPFFCSIIMGMALNEKKKRDHLDWSINFNHSRHSKKKWFVLEWVTSTRNLTSL